MNIGAHLWKVEKDRLKGVEIVPSWHDDYNHNHTWQLIIDNLNNALEAFGVIESDMMDWHYEEDAPLGDPKEAMWAELDTVGVHFSQVVELVETAAKKYRKQ